MSSNFAEMWPKEVHANEQLIILYMISRTHLIHKPFYYKTLIYLAG